MISGCSVKRVNKFSDQIFDSAHDLKLDVYTPRKSETPKKILVFIHGGNWVQGKKSLYRFFGNGIARKNIACVVISYRLSPKTDIVGMADDVAMAVKWIKENALNFNGDTNNIFISGHSAGGHLAAMVALDDHYFEKLKMKNPIKGAVLIDAFGLDMYNYLRHSNNKRDTIYRRVFTDDSVNWKKYSPVYHLAKNKPKFIQFVGGKTNEIIKEMNAAFYDELQKYQPDAHLIIVKGKRHVPMIFQFYNPWVKSYEDILNFIKP
ncbi:MAG: alpha/beta hydrolase [Burkholderiales bacterium]|nr:alpha/beta hydrolase [Bacteroidia bacterium]